MDKYNFKIAKSLIYFVIILLTMSLKSFAHKGKKCGFADVLTGKTVFIKFSPKDSQNSYISSDGYFTIYYDTTGYNAVNLTDRNENKIPDIVEITAYHADKAWRLMIDTIGFHRPYLYNGDFVTNYPITIKNLSNILYGHTLFNTSLDIPSIPGNNYESFIELNNNYDFADHLSDDSFTRDSMGVAFTISHEFFHAVQLGYHIRIENGSYTDLWWIEASAVYFEEACTPQMNDYFEYLPDYYASLDRPVNLNSGTRIYGEVLLSLAIAKNYSQKSLLKIWDNIYDMNAIDAIKKYLKKKDSSWSELLAIVGSWINRGGIEEIENKDYPDQPLWPQYNDYTNISLADGENIIPKNTYEYSISLMKCSDIPEGVFWFYPLYMDGAHVGLTLGETGKSAVTQYAAVKFTNSNFSPFLKMSFGWESIDSDDQYLFKIDTFTQAQEVKVTVFPNPVNYNKHNWLAFNADENIKMVKIFSVLGECLLELTPEPGDQYVSIATNQLKEKLNGGVYIYIIETSVLKKGKLFVIP